MKGMRKIATVVKYFLINGFPQKTVII